MAILKHTTSKNANYNDALFYLLFEHEENSIKPVLDENGKMVRRRGYILDGINCNPFTYAEECRELNEQYHKNQTPAEIKAHHYIISFDPQDQVDRGLTPERAQAIGMEYAKKNFPGHQTLVCTHVDGSHGSGNIHVHIVINSLRKFDVEPQEFMERPCDSRAGYKHHQTRDYLTHMQRSLMAICQRENLHQVDLLSPAKAKVTEREYWAQQRGQKELDKTNQEVIAFGLTPARTKFQTEKQYLRDAIDDVARSAISPEQFCAALWEKYKIRVTDKRGRFSYLHPDRSKNITDRALGSAYERDYLLSLFARNLEAERGEQKSSADNRADFDRANEPVSADALFGENIPEFAGILFLKTDLRLVVDLQNNVKAQQSRAYAQKVKISNLQQMAKTIAYVQENSFDSRKELQSAYDDLVAKRKEARKSLRHTEDRLKSVNQLIHYTGQYLANKGTYREMLKAPNKKKFRLEHQAEIELYEAAVKFLKSQAPDGKIPSMKSLKKEKENLTIQRKAQQETYDYFKDYASEMKTVCANVEAILGRVPAKEAEHTKQHDLA